MSKTNLGKTFNILQIDWTARSFRKPLKDSWPPLKIVLAEIWKCRPNVPGINRTKLALLTRLAGLFFTFNLKRIYWLKVHCHAIQWFYVDFLRSKMAARRLEAAAPANEKQAFAALFFHHCFGLRDQSTSGYQSVTLAKLFLSRTKKMGFEIRSRNWKQKNKFAHEKWGKLTETKAGLRSSTDRSWVVWVRRSFKTREAFRCSCVYFATQYNVHYDNRQAGHLLSALRLERCSAAIIFPHNKMAQKITE